MLSTRCNDRPPPLLCIKVLGKQPKYSDRRPLLHLQFDSPGTLLLQTSSIGNSGAARPNVVHRRFFEHTVLQGQYRGNLSWPHRYPLASTLYIERDPVRGYQWASPAANKDKEIDRDKNKDTRRQTGPRHKHEQRAGSGEYRGWTSGLNTPRRAGRMGKQGASCLRAALSTRRGRVDRPSPGPAPFWPNASGSPEGAV